MKRTLFVLAAVACGGAEPAPVVTVVEAPPAAAPAPPPPPPAPAPATPPGEPDGIPQTVWIERMITVLPPRVCAAKFFQQCFVAGSAECESAVQALTRSCIRDRRGGFPRFFDADSGRREGTKIGECVGTAYELDMRGKGRFVNSAACNDPSQWQ